MQDIRTMRFLNITDSSDPLVGKLIYSMFLKCSFPVFLKQFKYGTKLIWITTLTTCIPGSEFANVTECVAHQTVRTIVVLCIRRNKGRPVAYLIRSI